jgi:hypothetical protein
MKTNPPLLQEAAFQEMPADPAKTASCTLPWWRTRVKVPPTDTDTREREREREKCECCV